MNHYQAQSMQAIEKLAKDNQEKGKQIHQLRLDNSKLYAQLRFVLEELETLKDRVLDLEKSK